MKKTAIKIVLDTNIFVNPDSRHFFGKTSVSALNNFLDLLEQKKNVSAFMPPSVYEELMKFIDKRKLSKKIILIDKKAPSKYELTLPSLFLYEFIEEMRNRINKGLRIGEKYTRKALSDSEIKEQELIKPLREEYRVGLREGIVDSKEDCDLLLLAKELNAYLATSDQGLVLWAQKLGISCITAEDLKTFIT